MSILVGLVKEKESDDLTERAIQWCAKNGLELVTWREDNNKSDTDSK